MNEYRIWPVHYDDEGTKYRVVKYENNIVVYEHVFATEEAAIAHVEMNADFEWSLPIG